jgi:TRAP-type transport system periplasmic protein
LKKLYLVPLSILLLVVLLAGCAQQAPAPATSSDPAPKTSAAPAPTSAAPATSSAPAPATSAAPAPTTAAAAKPAPIVFKYGHDLPPTVAPVAGLNWWAEQVTKQTEGRVKVELYPSNTLATQLDGLEALRSGVADMFYISLPTHRKFFPISQFAALSGLGFPDDTVEANVAHATTFMEMIKKYPSLAAEFKDFAPPFFYIIYSQSYLCLKSKKVTTPAELKGVKVGSNGMRLDLVNRIGGVGVTDTPPTAYEKMQTGVTDGAFAAISAVHDFKIYEVAKYVQDVPFGGGAMMQLVNKKTWDKISPQDQKIMIDLGPEASKRSSQALADANNAAWKEVIGMNKKLSVTKEERALWNKEFSVNWDQYIKDCEAAGAKDGRDILNYWQAASDKAWAAHP